MPIFLKMEPVKGEAKQKGFEAQLEVQSFQWGAGIGASRESGGFSFSAPSVSEISLTKSMDSGSLSVVTEMFKATHIKEALLTFARAEGGSLVKYLEIKLGNPYITGYSMSSGGDRPSESISLTYKTIELNWVELDKTGKTKAAPKFMYDVEMAKMS